MDILSLWILPPTRTSRVISTEKGIQENKLSSLFSVFNTNTKITAVFQIHWLHGTWKVRCWSTPGRNWYALTMTLFQVYFRHSENCFWPKTVFLFSSYPQNPSFQYLGLQDPTQSTFFVVYRLFFWQWLFSVMGFT